MHIDRGFVSSEVFEKIGLMNFNPKTHTYTLGQDRIPSVTTVMNEVKPIPDGVRLSDKFIFSCEFGTEVHQLTEADDQGIEREPERMGGVYACADKWHTWVQNHGVEILGVEIPVYSKKHWYAGRVDRIIRLNGKVYVVDIKTGKYNTKNSVQVSGYVLAAREMGMKIDGGLVVSLHDTIAKPTSVDIVKYTARWLEILTEYTAIQFGG